MEKRLWEHQQGKGAKYIAKRLPITLVFTEWFTRIDEAFYWEKQVQGWSRAKREALIRGEYDDLPHLASQQSKQD